MTLIHIAYSISFCSIRFSCNWLDNSDIAKRTHIKPILSAKSPLIIDFKKHIKNNKMSNEPLHVT